MMIASIQAVAAAMLAAGGAVPVHEAAQAVPQQEVVEQTQNEEDVAQLMEDFERHMFELDFDQALAIADGLEPPTREGRGIVAGMRASALLGLKRNSEAERLIAESERLAPQEALPSYFLLSAGLLAERFDVAADAMDRMIARFPDVVRNVQPELVWFLLRNEAEDQKARNEDRRIALARLGFGGDTGDYLTSDAVTILVERGDIAAAGDLLKHIDEPIIVEDLLIQKRYAPLWPRLETMAGAHLQTIRQSLVAAAERAYAEAPDDPEKLQLLANAYRHAGRLDEAIALRSKLPSTPDEMASADEETGWAVNNVALALHEAERDEEADQLFAMLNEAPMESGGWRVSMIINRLELLVADGKFDLALALLALTETSARDNGNDYARQLVRRLKYCTLSRLGRREEAAKILPQMLENADDAVSATIDGLICAGEIDRAEKLTLASLDDDEFQAQFVRQLQARPLSSDDPSVWAHGWRELRQRPAIAREFERLGRDLPEMFLPPEKVQSEVPAA